MVLTFFQWGPDENDNVKVGVYMCRDGSVGVSKGFHGELYIRSALSSHNQMEPYI